MFDKLVESSSTGADLRPRRRIFVASFFFVAVLFVTAVVASIYAADFDLGTDNFDIAELLTPVTETEPQPEPERVQPRHSSEASTSERPSRQMNILRIDELPSEIPPISTERSQYRSRPVGDFDIRRGPETDGRPAEPGIGVPGGGGLERSSNPSFVPESVAVAANPPPPAPPRPKGPVSGGVMTGKATYLPKPAYSAAAKAVGAQGTVTVQILVDENGKVVSAKAANGHTLLRPAAVEAALKARFDPTTLSGVPVKVTGIITYNFTKP